MLCAQNEVRRGQRVNDVPPVTSMRNWQGKQRTRKRTLRLEPSMAQKLVIYRIGLQRRWHTALYRRQGK